MSNPVARTVKDFCQAYGIDEILARRLIDKGDIKSVRFGRTILIPEDSARDWLNGHTTPDKLGLVYIVGFNFYVKIGFTTDLDGRITALQTGVPEKIIVYGTILNASVDIEAKLHKRFSQYRVQREWFRKEGELAAWIEAGCKL